MDCIKNNVAFLYERLPKSSNNLNIVGKYVIVPPSCHCGLQSSLFGHEYSGPSIFSMSPCISGRLQA